MSKKSRPASNKGTFQWNGQTYAIDNAQIAIRNPDGSIGALEPIPSVTLVELPSEGASEPIFSALYQHTSGTISLTFSTRRQWRIREFDAEIVMRSYEAKTDLTHIFRLEVDETVSALCRINLPPQERRARPRWWQSSQGLRLMAKAAAHQELPPHWYFINIIDRAVWKWALAQGLQLDDAVRELNRMWRAGRL